VTDQILGSFKLLKRLGRGGYAEVWKAQQSRPRRIVALKILRNDLWEPGEAQTRFEREAEAAGKLFHPQIATVLEIGETGGRSYIAMQLIDGPSLADALKGRGALPWDESLRVIEQVASALDYAHSQGLIHRDVKPANIILGNREGAVLTDFGLVRAINLASQSIDDPSKGQVGTPHYKPPELWLGEKRSGPPTPATDVYSLACVLVEMLSGKRLFAGDSLDEVITAHLVMPPELPSDWPSSVPPGLDDVLGKALAKQMDERYALAGVFINAIQNLVATEQARKQAANRKRQETLAQKKQQAAEQAHQKALQAAIAAAERETEARLRAEFEDRLAQEQTRLEKERQARTQAEASLAQAQQQAALIAQEAAAKAEALKRQSQVAPQGENQIRLTLAPGVELELIRIPAGPFLMGSDKAKDKDADSDETPQHRVELGEYWIGKTPLTVAQFAAFVQASGYQTTAEKKGSAWGYTGKEWETIKGANWRQPRGPQSDVKQKQNHPVTAVSWDDAVAFCEWASLKTGQKISLPSEAEWEKAARGAEGRIWPWGNQPPDNNLCNFNLNIKDTTPVGQYSPGGDSPYGCVDMAGNVWEWTRSLFKAYPYDAEDGRENLQSRNMRVLRGGSFYYDHGNVRCAYRYRSHPNYRSNYRGFRVLLAPIAERSAANSEL